MKMTAILATVFTVLMTNTVQAEIVRIQDGKNVFCEKPSDVGTDGYRAYNESTTQVGDKVVSRFSLVFLICTPNGWQTRTALAPIQRKTYDGRDLEMRILESKVIVSTEEYNLVKEVVLDDKSIIDVEISANVNDLLSAESKNRLDQTGSVKTRVDLTLVSLYETFVNGESFGRNNHIGGTFGILIEIKK